MNNSQPYPQIPLLVHADNIMEGVNRVIGAMNFLIDRYNGVELPAYDPVTEWAANNGVSALPRVVQVAAYKAANPTAPDPEQPSGPIDPVSKYAQENGLTHLSYDVQEAAYKSAQPQE